jgi:hypothetical protein
LPGTDSGPSVFGLLHSKAVTAAVPTTSRISVAQTTIRVCSVHLDGVNSSRRSSKRTGKPRPPAMIATAIVTETTGSVAKRIRLSL